MNPLPLIRLPRSKSISPSLPASSQCGTGVKSNFRGSPHSRMVRLSFSSWPTGTLSCAMFGIRRATFWTRCSISRTSASISLIRSETSRIRVISADASSPARFILLISSETVFRSALSSSTSVSLRRQSSSASRNSSRTASSIPLSLMFRRTASAFARMNLGSSMSFPHWRTGALEYWDPITPLLHYSRITSRSSLTFASICDCVFASTFNRRSGSVWLGRTLNHQSSYSTVSPSSSIMRPSL